MRRLINIFKGDCLKINEIVAEYNVGLGYVVLKTDNDKDFLLCRHVDFDDYNETSHTYITDIGTGKVVSDEVLIIQRNVPSMQECCSIIESLEGNLDFINICKDKESVG